MNVSYAAKALGGDVAGRVSVLCPGPGHSPRDRSLSVRFNTGDDFTVYSHSGDDWRMCRDHVAARLGITDHRRRGRARPHAARARPAIVESEPRSDRSELVRLLWSRARPIGGTPAETYLRIARGYAGPLPPTLRYLPARGRHPHAMLAAFGLPCEPEPGALAITVSDVRGLHLTHLAPDGVAKLGKITIGRGVTAPIVLAAPNDSLGLAITEGIEDALSLHAATGLGTWAAGAAGRLPALSDAVPGWIDCVTVAADADPAGRKGAAALATALRARGLHVETRELHGGDR